jgi:regulator of replication initiation timing
MTDREVQKLGRKDLVEILYYLSRENDSLREENAQLKARLDALVGEAIAAKNQMPEPNPPATSAESTEV